MASATTTVTVKLADLAPVQRLVVAAAGVISRVDSECFRVHAEWTEIPVRLKELAELLAALEGLEAAK